MALIQCNFFSGTLGMASSMNVILPDRPRNGQKGHPCLYLLHGHSDDHTIWERRTSIERYVADMDIVVVMPNVHRSFYADMVNGYNYWTFISEELPAKVDSYCHISRDRADTFVAGLSMGGYGAFKLALQCPDRFAAAASLSGALDLPALVRERRKTETPSNFDLVFGKDTEITGTSDDLMKCAEDLVNADAQIPQLYQCCGTADFLYENNIRFRDHVRKLGLDLTYEEHAERVHEWGYWDERIQDVLKWLPLRTSAPAGQQSSIS